MEQDPYSKIRFTIATVTYNAENTLQRTLDSVAAQTYPNIEHLIIDGCSKDQTMEMVHRYVDANTGKDIPHDIHMIREPDKGLYDAMNKAIENAEGDYICFLNAGDTLHSPDTISLLAREIAKEKKKPAIVYGETDLVDAEGNFIRHRRLQAPKKLQWRSFRWGMLVCHQSFYARTDIAKKERYNLEYRFSADYDWCIRIMKLAAKLKQPIYNSRLILTNYLSEGLTTQNHRESLQERFHIMTNHFGWIPTIMQHIYFVLRAFLKK